MENIIKIEKSLEVSGLLLKGVTETVQKEVKELKGGFLSMLLGSLGVILLGNILAVKERQQRVKDEEYIEREKVKE